MSETIANYTVPPTETMVRQLADRCRSLERQLQACSSRLRHAQPAVFRPSLYSS